ncbi:MAG: S9 family peptidase [Rhizobiales bacterium]|nr:S9 family peptidase [Hyphomicrobiales bacterium]
MNDAPAGRSLGAPQARRIREQSTHHGIERSDDYAWLRADNWREVMRDPTVLAPEIRAHLEAENAYTEQMLAETGALQDALYEEMRGRIKEDDSTVPAPDGPYAYYTSFVDGGQHPLVCREPRGGGAREVLIDGNALAEGQAYFQLGGASHSPDHRYLVYGSDVKGSEYYDLSILDTQDGKLLSDTIADTSGGAVWAADSRTLFYTRLDDNHRPSRIFRHRLGDDPADDVLVFEEQDPGFFAGIGKTQSGEYLVISTHTHETSELHLIPARAPDAAPRLVVPRETGHECSLEHHGQRLFLLTNRDGAEDFRIVEAPLDDPSPDNWQEIIDHQPGRLILSITAYRDHLVRLERADGLPRIVVRRLADGAEHSIEFKEQAYSLGLVGGFEFDTGETRFTYSSMTTPSQVFDYELETRERRLRKTQEVPSGHNPDDYVTQRIFAAAKDGEHVPVSLLYRKETKLDGSAPCLLYGYGAYGIAMPASFSTNRLSLVDRGFVYAIAHIRGGKEKGYRWYREGKAAAKTNTFTDFIAAGEHLCAQNFTRKGQIVAHGGSAGGMLMGAVANMAPNLFAGIIGEVPFVDVLATMLDDTLPLTPPEWPEWGNPIVSAEDYNTIAAYSPYDNVSDLAYPPILALAGLTDPRVTYWEPAKWIAKLRAMKSGEAPVLLRTNMDSGHGGASGRFDRLKEVALAYAFALHVTGAQEASG